MSNFTMAQAKQDFKRGLLGKVRIVAAMPGMWTVQLTSKLEKDGTGLLVDARKKKPRQMKSLDAAVATVAQIGFEIKQLIVV